MSNHLKSFVDSFLKEYYSSQWRKYRKHVIGKKKQQNDPFRSQYSPPKEKEIPEIPSKDIESLNNNQIIDFLIIISSEIKKGKAWLDIVRQKLLDIAKERGFEDKAIKVSYGEIYEHSDSLYSDVLSGYPDSTEDLIKQIIRRLHDLRSKDIDDHKLNLEKIIQILNSID